MSNKFTKSRTSKFANKFAAATVGFATAFAMSVGGTSIASAQTPAELQAQIAGLLATIQSLQAQLSSVQGGGSMSSGMMMSAPVPPLTMGSKGAEVMKLQEWLVSKGYSIPAGATGYFGAQTQSALAAFQAANGISPASGYYGPITAASVSSMLGASHTGGTGTGTATGTYPAGCTSWMGFSSTTGWPCTGTGPGTGTGTGTGTTVMDGTDGSITLGTSAAVSSGQTVKKGETKKVLSTKLQATGGPVNLTRVDVRFSERPWLTMSKVELMNSNGTVIATKMLSGASDANEVTVGSAYDVRIDGFSHPITPGTDLHLVVAVTVLSASDKITGQTVTVFIPASGIRTVNGKGISDSLGTASNSFTYTLPTTGSSANIFTRISPSSPVERIVTVSTSQITEEVVLGVFGVKAENQSATINTLNFNFNNSTGVGTTTLFQDVKICDGSTCYGANSLAAGNTNFTNLTIPLTQDAWKDLTLKADVALSATSNGVIASTTIVAAAIAGIDANFNSLVVSGASNATSNNTTFLVTGLQLTNPTATVGTAIVQNNTTVGYNANYAFTLTNTGNSDAYVSKTVATMLSTSTTPASIASSTISVVTASPDTYAGDTSTAYVIPAGASRTFTFTGRISPAAGGGAQTVTLQVTAVNFGSSSGAPTGSTINYNLSALKLTSSF